MISWWQLMEGARAEARASSNCTMTRARELPHQPLPLLLPLLLLSGLVAGTLAVTAPLLSPLYSSAMVVSERRMESMVRSLMEPMRGCRSERMCCGGDKGAE